MPTQKKIEQVAEIEGKFNEANACWFVDARGLTVQESQELRVKIREAGASMHVYKNNLAAIAIKNANLPEVPEILAGPTAFIFTGEEVAAPAKVLKDFSKDHPALEIKGGIMDGAVQDVEATMKIADLPSKEVLIAKLLGTLQAPLTGLVRCCNGPIEATARAIKAIAEQKEAA